MRNARSRFDTDEAAGQDSFLDIVANIVGILILLVMVVGVRAARRVEPTGEANVEPPPTVAEVETPPEVESPPQIEVAELQKIEEQARTAVSEVLNAERDLQSLAVRAASARNQVKLDDEVRVQLATFVATAEEELEQKRQELAEDERADYDKRVEIAKAQRKLEELTRKQVAQISVDSHVETLENLPTPIAKTVNGDEVFLLLSEGAVTVMPLDALREQLYRQLDRRINQLSQRDSLSFVVGPIGGFRMRFLAEKARVATPNGFRVVVRPMWELLPNDDLLSEPVDQAIREGSALMTELASYPPRRTSVTVVTYSDSFNEFRTLKKELYRLGYAVAGRPHEIGQPIIGSPQGTRSAAQ